MLKSLRRRSRNQSRDGLRSRSRTIYGGQGLIALLIALSVLVTGPILLHAQTPGRYDHYVVDDPDLLPLTEYAARRAEVLRRLPAGGVMLVRASDVRTRSNDVDYPYRQRNNLLYLSGVVEPKSVLLLVRDGVEIDGERRHEILIVADRSPDKEIWVGYSMGPVVAAKVTGIASVHTTEELGGILADLLPKSKTLYYDDWFTATVQDPLLDTLVDWEGDMLRVLKQRYRQLIVKKAGSILNEMRVVKSPAEIELMRKAIAITIEGHRATIRSARPGMFEYELAATMEYTFHRLGSESPGYPSIVGSGPNSCILHYEAGRRRMEAGDVVLMDCGAEYHGYSADVTRSLPVSGRFTEEQRTIYNLVLEAQDSGIAACRVGFDFREPHRRAVDVIAAGLVRLGILSDEKEYSEYFMHGTSHFLGMDVHDVGLLGRLKPGMILTVEPGIYIPAGSDCDKKWWNIGIRIEDDILVTQQGPENLSGALARTAAEIERIITNP